MKRMRFETLELLIPVLGEKECARKAFECAHELTKYLQSIGIETERLE